MNNLLNRMRSGASRFGAKLPHIKNKYVRTAAWMVAMVLLFIVSGFTYAYASTPANIRSPKFEHLHFRMQILMDGKALNFADKKYQEGYSKDNCNADLTLTPVHFHDGKDQFVHIHWRDMTGGQVLKYYGWNYIGGVDGMLGYRFGNFPNLQTVPIHGKDLPAVPEGDSFYVYSGDEQLYVERSFDEFKNKKLEDFFGVSSNVLRSETSWLDKLFPKAYAHGTEEHDATNTETPQETLKRINNLIGNVVIFVQKDKPTDDQIRARFAALEPLSESTCGG